MDVTPEPMLATVAMRAEICQIEGQFVNSDVNIVDQVKRSSSVDI